MVEFLFLKKEKEIPKCSKRCGWSHWLQRFILSNIFKFLLFLLFFFFLENVFLDLHGQTLMAALFRHSNPQNMSLCLRFYILKPRLIRSSHKARYCVRLEHFRNCIPMSFSLHDANTFQWPMRPLLHVICHNPRHRSIKHEANIKSFSL